ncbi:MAG TPA: hypothetical protein VKV06_15070, partial [Acidimicrobiales bacterium]|nr:hypothetical protein [Acidimicrobiales bacterium]
MPSEEAPLAGVGWSSSLSVAEAAAIREAGFQARGLVMGSSVYHLGVSYSPSDYARMTVGPWDGNFGGAGIGGGPWGGGGYQGPGGFTGRGFGGGWNGPGGGGGWRPTTFPGWCKYYSADDLGWGAGWTGLSVPSLGLGYAPAGVCWERTV